MPASAAKPIALSLLDSTDTAPRSVQPVRPKSTIAPYGAPTLDLFADDAERATLQAMNTDVRQGTLAGFELPEAFMAAVEATASADDPLALVRLSRPALPESSNTRDTANADEVSSLDLFIDTTSSRPTKPD
jgi:hypothetical protein